MSQNTTVILEAQPDWLTGSATGPERSEALRQQAAQWAMSEEALGNRISKWSVQEYQGNRCGRVAVGQAEGDRTILQLSGDLAAQHLHAALPLLSHLTRIDLAVTIQTPEHDYTIGENAWQMAAWYWDGHPRSAVPWRIEHRREGTGVYVGSRNSDRFLRIYDKHEECRKHHDERGVARYANSWRYELELKGPPAPSIAVLADAAPDRPAHVQGILSNYLRDHGIEPAYTMDAERLLLPGFTRRSDVESRLYNLARNVRPSLEWLADAGHAADALAALGLGVNPYHERDE